MVDSVVGSLDYVQLTQISHLTSTYTTSGKQTCQGKESHT